MSGLVYKDLMNMRRYLKQLLLIFVVFVFIFSFSGNNYSFVAAYGVMLSAMVVLSSMAYDEQAKWDKYALTMPLSRRSLVGAKYLLGLLTVGAGGLLSLAVVVGTALFSGGSRTEGLASVGACLCAVSYTHLQNAGRRRPGTQPHPVQTADILQMCIRDRVAHCEHQPSVLLHHLFKPLLRHVRLLRLGVFPASLPPILPGKSKKPGHKIPKNF